MEKKLKLIKNRPGPETVFDHACKSHVANIMAFVGIKIEDILSLQAFSVIVTSLSIDLSS